MADNATTVDTSSLTYRGIAEPAKLLHWETYTYKGNPGWRYPIWDIEGNVIGHRWKARTPGVNDAPKYVWLPSKPDHPSADYYLPPGLQQAIQDADGHCWFASGEPDVLTFHAMGIFNVFCTTHTELKIPNSLPDLLERLGVKYLHHAPDVDETGFKGAAMLQKVRSASYIYILPGKPGSKLDINQHYQNVGLFDPYGLPTYPVAFFSNYLDEPELKRRERRSRDKGTNNTHIAFDDSAGVPKALLLDVIREIEIQTGMTLQFKDDGWTTTRSQFSCIHPGHEDKHASAGFNKLHGGYSCLGGCGGMGVDDTARVLGINPDLYYPQKREQASSHTEAQPPPEKDPAVIPGHHIIHDPEDVYEAFGNFINGDLEQWGTAVPFPFASMHRHGGIFKWTPGKKQVIWGGPSGGTKTIFGEAISDRFAALNIAHFHLVTEWDRMEMLGRRAQRHMDTSGNGVKLVKYLDFVAMSQGEHEINNPTRTAISQCLAQFRSQGSVYLMDDLRQYGDVLTLEQVLLACRDMILHKRQEGDIIKVLILDYLSDFLVTPTRRISNPAEYALQLVKEFLKRMGLVGHVFSQLTQAGENRFLDGEKLRVNDLYYARQDKGNGICLIQRDMHSNIDHYKSMDHAPAGTEPQKPYVDEHGNPWYKNTVQVKLPKNSLEAAAGASVFHYNWERRKLMEGKPPS